MVKDKRNTSKNSNINLVKIGELSKLSGFRYSTIKYYTEVGILPYEQQDTHLARRYDKAQALERLKEIQALKDKRLTIEEIIKHFM